LAPEAPLGLCSGPPMSQQDEQDLVAAATALEGTLERLREVVERALHGTLTSRKQIERTAAALTALGPLESEIGVHARALVAAIDRSRRMQEDLTGRAHARALELQARSAELQLLMDSLGQLGQETHRVAGTFEGLSSAESLAAAAMELDALVARARDLAEQAGSRGFEDVRRQVDSLRQQLSAARNRLSLSGGPARA
jgi:methyl-accepting chemotaxis protein